LTDADRASRHLHFLLPADMGEVMQCVRRMEVFLREAGCGRSCAGQLALVAEEILVNVLQDAWPGREPGYCAVDACAAAMPDGVAVSLRVEDDGIAFDPTRADAPDTEASLDDRAVGGLGILLVRSMTDAQSYCRAGEHNIFEVSKFCAAEMDG